MRAPTLLACDAAGLLTGPMLAVDGGILASGVINNVDHAPLYRNVERV
jgi:hypothetical protein